MNTVFHVSSPNAGGQHHATVNAANPLADESVHSSGSGELARLKDEGFGSVNAP